MTQTFTANLDVIRYLFNETNAKENLEIEQGLAFDTEQLDFYLDCLSIRTDLNKIKLEPQNSTLEKIFSYSRNFEPAI